MTMKTPYEVNTTKLISIVDESSTIRTFRLEPKPIEFKAGQFAELAVPGVGEAPFTQSSSQYDNEKMEFTIMKVGRLTSALFNLKPGDTVGVRGPYGKPYPVEKFKGKEVFIVGGGVGFAPLRALFLTLLHKVDDYKKIYIRYGARTPDDIIYKQFIPEWSKLDKVDIKMSVDVGTKDWQGKVGVVTVLLDEIPVSITDSSVIVCGPPIMIKFVTKKLLELGFPGSNIYLSMESNMSCGIGQCNHCRIGELYSCKDGPVFTWDQIKHIKDPFI
ncbi:MAG: FAD/NAD(P)-binding protein [bacterium]|nr:FAD/NAD(P)-binding protein [bacterium]